MYPEPDVVLGRRYALIRRIAVGGMGEVWEATDTLLGRSVAVKIMKEEFRTAPTFLARFRAEARHAGQLNHPGIAAVYDYGETDAAAFLVMELVSGRPLSELMVRQPALSAAAKLSVLAQAANNTPAGLIVSPSVAGMAERSTTVRDPSGERRDHLSSVV